MTPANPSQARTAAPRGLQTCSLCGRELKDWQTCEENDPAMNCGGDCLACMKSIETGWEHK